MTAIIRTPDTDPAPDSEDCGEWAMTLLEDGDNLMIQNLTVTDLLPRLHRHVDSFSLAMGPGRVILTFIGVAYYVEASVPITAAHIKAGNIVRRKARYQRVWDEYLAVVETPGVNHLSAFEKSHRKVISDYQHMLGTSEPAVCDVCTRLTSRTWDIDDVMLQTTDMLVEPQKPEQVIAMDVDVPARKNTRSRRSSRRRLTWYAPYCPLKNSILLFQIIIQICLHVLMSESESHNICFSCLCQFSALLRVFILSGA